MTTDLERAQRSKAASLLAYTIAVPGEAPIAVVIRRPPAKELSRILAAGNVTPTAKGKPDPVRVACEAAHACTYLAGTNRRFFENVDADWYAKHRGGSWFEDLAGIATTFILNRIAG